MTDRSRLEALKQVGQMAWKGLITTVKGVDVVIDPNEPKQSEPPEGGLEAGIPLEGPVIGSDIGRRAMRFNEHRMASTRQTTTGSAIAAEDLLQRVPMTLALYPGPAATIAEELLGVTGHLISPDGDLEQEATMRDVAWLPLEMGLRYFGRVSDGRLVAAGGYQRAALVRFGDSLERADIWCGLGEDLLYRLLPESPQGQLIFEESDKLWRAIAGGRVKRALVGGDSVDRALAEGGTIEAELMPPAGLPWIPVWGLFAQRRQLSLQAVDRGALVFAPVEELPGLLAWTEAVTCEW